MRSSVGSKKEYDKSETRLYDEDEDEDEDGS